MTSPTASSPWSWLEDTYWYVPPESLPALRFDKDGSSLTWLVDQTVWYITGYRLGYFWGVCSALLHNAGEEVPEQGQGSQPKGFTMLGSITPEGQVHLTFIPVSPGSATIGTGRMVPHRTEWSFQMQMSTGVGSQTNAHWAYMVRVRQGDPSWDSLPGIGLSVPQMLEGLEPPEVIASPRYSRTKGSRPRNWRNAASVVTIRY